MKRSQMLQRLLRILQDEPELPPEQLAQRLLTECEDAGMLAPRTVLSYLYDIQDNAWEDE